MVHFPLRFDSLRLLRAHRCALTLLLFGLGGQAGCRGSAAPGEGSPLLALTSPGIQAGEIPKKHTCDGADASPELKWSGAPAGTQSFALIAIDLDAPLGEFVHWAIYDLPAAARELPEGLPAQEQLADGSRQGRNDFGGIGYGGPCPPGSAPHRYVFRLYALDTKLNLPAGATRSQVEEAMKGHILAHGELMVRYRT
ncbi:MAG: YbhB/YbcL family Raf kinase inhibitor-like protein [Terracidiphilus sp.]